MCVYVYYYVHTYIYIYICMVPRTRKVYLFFMVKSSICVPQAHLPGFKILDTRASPRLAGYQGKSWILYPASWAPCPRHMGAPEAPRYSDPRSTSWIFDLGSGPCASGTLYGDPKTLQGILDLGSGYQGASGVLICLRLPGDEILERITASLAQATSFAPAIMPALRVSGTVDFKDGKATMVLSPSISSKGMSSSSSPTAAAQDARERGPAKIPLLSWSLSTACQPTASPSPLSSCAWSLQIKACVLLMLLLNVASSSIYLLLGPNRKLVAEMRCGLDQLWQSFVIKREKGIFMGDGKKWINIEAGEACFDKRDVEESPTASSWPRSLREQLARERQDLGP